MADIDISTLLDPYDRVARIYPALLTVSPAVLLLLSLYDTSNIALSGFASALIVSCAAYILSRIGREAGKRIQDDLFRRWGGAPSIQILRHSNSRLDIHTKERLHAFLGEKLGKKLPTAIEEKDYPARSDDLYCAATTWLIGQTRDKKAYPLLFKENIAYGFHRNALGLKPIGLSVSMICAAWVLINFKIIGLSAPYFSLKQLLLLKLAPLAALTFSVTILLSWLFVFNERAVEGAGFSYAERLMEGCDKLNTPKFVAPQHSKAP